MNQAALEKFIVKEFLGETNYAQTDGTKWWFVVYGLAEASEWQASVDNHPAFKVTDTRSVPDEGFVIEFCFIVPPRVAYDSDNQPAILELMHRIGALERENARLRAAGLAIAPHTVEEDSISDTLWCGACRVSMRDDEDFIHADDCPTRVFTDAPVTLVLTMTDDTTARYPDVSMADVQQVQGTLAGRYTGATHAVFYSEGVQRGIPLEEIKGVETE